MVSDEPALEVCRSRFFGLETETRFRSRVSADLEGPRRKGSSSSSDSCRDNELYIISSPKLVCVGDLASSMGLGESVVIRAALILDRNDLVLSVRRWLTEGRF